MYGEGVGAIIIFKFSLKCFWKPGPTLGKHNDSTPIPAASYADVLLARRAIFSPQRASAETSGYLRRPITAHFQILEVTLRGDLEKREVLAGL